MKHITGIVLAGGRSNRMGTDKSLMIFNGKPLIQYAIDAISPFCDKVVISSREKDYSFTGCEAWEDELEEQASIIGIYTCLKRSVTEVNIILSCDMPLVVAPLVEYLIGHSTNSDVTIPIHKEDLWEPLCGIYRKKIIPVLKQSIKDGDFKLQNSLKKSLLNLIKIDADLLFYNDRLFQNINTITDFNSLSV